MGLAGGREGEQDRAAPARTDQRRGPCAVGGDPGLPAALDPAAPLFEGKALVGARGRAPSPRRAGGGPACACCRRSRSRTAGASTGRAGGPSLEVSARPASRSVTTLSRLCIIESPVKKMRGSRLPRTGHAHGDRADGALVAGGDDHAPATASASTRNRNGPGGRGRGAGSSGTARGPRGGSRTVARACPPGRTCR